MLLFLFRLSFFEDPSLQRERERERSRSQREKESGIEKEKKLSKSYTHYPRGKLMRAKKGFERKKSLNLVEEFFSPVTIRGKFVFSQSVCV